MARIETEATAAGTSSAVGVTIGGMSFSVVRKVHHPIVLGGERGFRTIGEVLDHLYAQVVQDHADGLVTRMEFELEDLHAQHLAHNIHMGK